MGLQNKIMQAMEKNVMGGLFDLRGSGGRWMMPTLERKNAVVGKPGRGSENKVPVVAAGLCR